MSPTVVFRTTLPDVAGCKTVDMSSSASSAYQNLMVQRTLGAFFKELQPCRPPLAYRLRREAFVGFLLQPASDDDEAPRTRQNKNY